MNPKVDKNKCTCNGFPLYGRVQVVEYAPDIEVKVVEFDPDLEVNVVEFGADECGLWKFVDIDPDIRIRFVDNGADLSIRFEEYSHGLR